MINGTLEQFLDTGWYSESTLYFDGYIYWLESQYDNDTKMNNFFIDKFKATNEDNLYYHPILKKDLTLDWERIVNISDDNIDRIKEQFLKLKIFNNQSFWEVQNQLVWLEESYAIVQEE